jgi:hypothetical protein
MKRMIAFLVLLMGAARISSGQSFALDVRHEHWHGGCNGRLTIDEQGIEFTSEESDHNRKWTYPDLKRIEIESRRKLSLLSYEDRKLRRWSEREFEFELRDGEITEEVYRVLRARSSKPLVSRIVYDDSPALFRLPAKHCHRLGGCNGALLATKEGIVYSTDARGEARVWSFADVTSISLIDPYSFRLSTRAETYVFDLKVPLTAEQYELLWAKVYRLDRVERVTAPKSAP